MTEKILCAIDVGHPEHELPVLRRAAQLAVMDRAELSVITVIAGFGMGEVASYFPKGTEKEMLERARVQLHTLTQETQKANPELVMHHIIAEGIVYDQVLITAEKIGATGIVIGSHRPDLKDFLLGSNAAKVARHANCSVYIVRA